MLSNFNITSIVFQIKDLVWSWPLISLLAITAIYQTFKLRGLQFKHLGLSLKLLYLAVKGDSKDKSIEGDISSFQSLMTALAGSIGTGNITGIATALTLGGPGALLWMWLMAFFGMATAYSEALLSLKYRKVNSSGNMAGGPMYTLLYGLKSPKLAFMFSAFAVVATIGTGCLVQANSVSDAIQVLYPNLSSLSIGIFLFLLVGGVILGGVRSIGKVAGIVVPIMALSYLSAGIFIIVTNFSKVLPSLILIFKAGLTGKAAIGGISGGAIMLAVQYGVSNGIFANEAGLGSLSIAAASAKNDCPTEQGLFAVSGVFIATMLVCTVTGLVLVLTGVLGTSVDGVLLTGSPLAIKAFSSVHPGMRYVVVIGLSFFAFTTILAWAYYGEKCTEYLIGSDKYSFIYKIIFTLSVILGATMDLHLVWAISHIFNGLMVIPNLVSILGLSNIVKHETDNYFNNISDNKSSVENSSYEYSQESVAFD